MLPMLDQSKILTFGKGLTHTEQQYFVLDQRDPASLFGRLFDL